MRIALPFILFAFLALTAFGYLEDVLDGYENYGFGRKESLFKTLNESNFNEVMHGGRQEFGLVFFCSSNFELCRLFTEKFFFMRMLTPNWSVMLKFYKVDCSEKANKDLCKKHNYKHAPVFRYYKPQSSNGDLGEKIKSYTSTTVLLTEVLKKMTKDYPTANCTTCPNLKSLPEWIHKPTQLWEIKEHYCVERVIFVVVESMESLRGVTDLIHTQEANVKNYPIWRVVRTNKELLDPHNEGLPDIGDVVGYSMEPKAAYACKQYDGRMTLNLNPKTQYEDSSKEVGFGSKEIPNDFHPSESPFDELLSKYGHNSDEKKSDTAN